MKHIVSILLVTSIVAASAAQQRPLSQLNSNVAVATAATASTQQSQPAQYVETRHLEVLTQEQIDPGRLLPPPSKDGSESQVIDLESWRQVVEDRTPERYAQARWDNEHEDISAFSAVLGPQFDLSKLPATAKLISEVDNDQHIAASAAKVYFHRRFPVAAAPLPGDYHIYSCDDDVKKPADRPFRSYPSGHATMGYTFAVVLSDLVPNKAQEILARAEDYAYSRRVCGDHYRSDTEASHALGSALGMMLLNNPMLKPQIEAAKKELLQAGVRSE